MALELSLMKTFFFININPKSILKSKTLDEAIDKIWY